jgi:hypothetical protein
VHAALDTEVRELVYLSGVTSQRDPASPSVRCSREVIPTSMSSCLLWDFLCRVASGRDNGFCPFSC